MTCPGCEKCAAPAGALHDFGSSLLLAADHQYFEGACVLWLKRHARELHELEAAEAAQAMEELRLACKAVAAAYRPWKLNLASLGNQVGHLHWHILPRYESDPDRLEHPWLRSERFAAHATSGAQRLALAARLKPHLPPSP